MIERRVDEVNGGWTRRCHTTNPIDSLHVTRYLRMISLELGLTSLVLSEGVLCYRLVDLEILTVTTSVHSTSFKNTPLGSIITFRDFYKNPSISSV